MKNTIFLKKIILKEKFKIPLTYLYFLRKAFVKTSVLLVHFHLKVKYWKLGGVYVALDNISFQILIPYITVKQKSTQFFPQNSHSQLSTFSSELSFSFSTLKMFLEKSHSQFRLSVNNALAEVWCLADKVGAFFYRLPYYMPRQLWSSLWHWRRNL